VAHTNLVSDDEENGAGALEGKASAQELEGACERVKGAGEELAYPAAAQENCQCAEVFMCLLAVA
jgi:hypothetical protein